MTERTLSQVQAAETILLCRLHGVTLGDKVRSCEIYKDLNVEPFPRIERSQVRWFGHVTRNALGKIGEAGPAGYTKGKAVQRSTEDQVA